MTPFPAPSPTPEPTDTFPAHGTYSLPRPPHGPCPATHPQPCRCRLPLAWLLSPELPAPAVPQSPEGELVLAVIVAKAGYCPGSQIRWPQAVPERVSHPCHMAVCPGTGAPQHVQPGTAAPHAQGHVSPARVTFPRCCQQTAAAIELCKVPGGAPGKPSPTPGWATLSWCHRSARGRWHLSVPMAELAHLELIVALPVSPPGSWDPTEPLSQLRVPVVPTALPAPGWPGCLCRGRTRAEAVAGMEQGWFWGEC